jgi:hypothetical protein
MQLVALDDLNGPARRLGKDCGQLRSLVVGVGEDTLDEAEQATGAAVEGQPGTRARYKRPTTAL